MRLSRLNPFRGYERRWLLADLAAGLVLTAFLVPVGMGYAEAAGLPAITGLYATVVPLLVYALLGPSKVMVLGPDSSLAPVIGAVIAPHVLADPSRAVAFAGALAIVIGTITLLAGGLRLGFVTELLSRPVQLGYLTAIAALVFVGQTPKLLGIRSSGENLPAQLQALVGGLSAANGYASMLGLASIGLIVLGRWFYPRIPSQLLAMLAGTLAVWSLDLGSRGVVLVGAVPDGFLKPALPRLSVAEWSALLPGAMGIAIVAVADTTVLSQSLANERRQEADPNRELLALGAADLAAGFFGGFPISSSASRTPVAIAAGAKSQLTGVVGALAICGILLAGKELLAWLPQPVLAGIVLVAAAGLVDTRAIGKLRRRSRSEFMLFCGAALGVALFGVLQGIFFAVLLSLGDFVRRAWRPHDAVLGRARGLKGYHDVQRFPDAERIPGLLLYRFDAPLFFANARHFRRRIRQAIQAHGSVRWLVIAAEPITDIDTTASEILARMIRELGEGGIVLAFAELKDPVKDLLKRDDLFDVVGASRFFPTVGTAVDAYLKECHVHWVDWEEQDSVSSTPSRQGADSTSAKT